MFECSTNAENLVIKDGQRDCVELNLELDSQSNYFLKFGIKYKNQNQEFINYYGQYHLYKLRDLIATIGKLLVTNYQFKLAKHQTQANVVKQKQAIIASKTVAKKVKEWWLSQLKRVDPIILEVHKRVFAATCRQYNILTDLDLYKQRFIVADILKYKAAACATHFLYKCNNSFEFQCRWNDASPFYENWMQLFAPEGKLYPSLNKTLMNLPKCPVTALVHLRLRKLERPIYTSLELCLCLAVFSLLTIGNVPNINIFIHADPAQITKSFQHYQNYLQTNCSLRTFRNVIYFARFLNDFPDKHNGNLVGLTNKAIRWHRQAEYNIRLASVKFKDPKTLTVQPISLPNNPNIKFLQTVDDIWQEGNIMGHCVSQYSDGAVQGKYFLFHVEYEKEGATVQVDNNYNVAQSYGSHNKKNVASEWARGILQRWGQKCKMIINNSSNSAEPKHELELPF